MTAPTWHAVATDLDIPAKPASGLWTLAVPFVPKGSLVKIEATSSWMYSVDDRCGPDGDPTAYMSAAVCLNKEAPVGALIGKVGGGTADNKGLVLFPVGSFCVVQLSAEQAGPLFLTINDTPGGLSDNDKALRVTVSLASP